MSVEARLRKIKNKWRLLILLKSLAWILIFLMLGFWLVNALAFPYWIGLIVAFLAVFILFKHLRILPKDRDVVTLINGQIKTVEYSGALLITNDGSALAQLQRKKIIKEFLEAGHELRFPASWKNAALAFLGVLLVVLASGFLGADRINNSPTGEQFIPLVGKEIKVEEDTVYISTADISIEAPRYTRQDVKKSKDLNITALEGSEITWEVSFSGSPEAVWIELNNEDCISLESTGSTWQTSLKAQESVYTVGFLKNGDKYLSQFYTMELLRDEPPVLEIVGVPQFQRLDHKPGLIIPFEVVLSDDFGLAEGHLVATITKGSGESVKFREQKIEFSTKPKGKRFSTRMELQTDDFDMEPGNELYFYAVAADNKAPTPQMNRTETYFFILKDTSQTEFSLQGSLGVDLMPDYFRSQLQIILDTEKLIAGKHQMSAYDFNSESNALGFDQKSLRIKYGQFIGEEDESGLEADREIPVVEQEETDGEDESVIKRFGHDTDHENEKGQWMDRGAEHDHDHHGHDHGDQHDHGHEESFDPETEEDPLEGFLHNHGDEETATFYTQTLKSKLKAALAEMWDAELYLRLYQPEKSLPYQYKAQELLKEIRNHARIYVQRIGFEPPPVNESESRLTGKLDELNRERFVEEKETVDDFETIRHAIAAIDNLIAEQTLDQQSRDILQNAGSKIAELAVSQPGEFLFLLNGLRRLIDIEELSKAHIPDLMELNQGLTAILPKDDQLPSYKTLGEGEYTDTFIEKLNKESIR